MYKVSKKLNLSKKLHFSHKKHFELVFNQLIIYYIH
jgi:hypothetical protein